MNTPRSWLTEYVDLQGISDEKFSREMTFSGNKVEAIHRINGESIYEFEITSNRPDTLSVIGLAREAAAVFDRTLRLPKVPHVPHLSKLPIRLTITDKKLCPVYSIVEFSGVVVKPSSPLIQKRLTLSGIRPVNNIVDLTNYLMLETGQPMHAFDADRINGVLVLRAAKQNEKIVPLDHKERTLHGGEIIIEDKEKLVDLAGLMGGLNTEISESTTRVLLLVPIYDPVAIRRASKFLRLRTEASTRFEKKLDLTQTETAVRRAIAIIEAETKGKQSTKLVTANARFWKAPLARLDRDRLVKLVGYEFTQKEIATALSKLGIKKTTKGYRSPPWRRDLTEEVDLVEEVTRLFGLNRLPRSLPTGVIPTHQDALIPNWRRIIADRVASLGYTETYGSTLVGKALIERLGFDPTDHLQVLRPMSVDFEYMRRSTVETLVPFLEKNLIAQDSVQLFELGTVFFGTQDDELPYQPLELGLIATNSYERIKGDIENVGKALGITLSFTLHKGTPVSLNFSHQVDIAQADEAKQTNLLGGIAAIHPDRLAATTQSSVWVAWLDVSLLLPKATTTMRYPRLSEFPPVIEEMTLTKPNQGGFLGEAIELLKASSPLVSSVEVKNRFERNVTLRVTFQSFDRSLTQEEVNQIKASAMEKVQRLGWVRRLAERSSPDSLQS